MKTVRTIIHWQYGEPNETSWYKVYRTLFEDGDIGTGSFVAPGNWFHMGTKPIAWAGPEHIENVESAE